MGPTFVAIGCKKLKKINTECKKRAR